MFLKIHDAYTMCPIFMMAHEGNPMPVFESGYAGFPLHVVDTVFKIQFSIMTYGDVGKRRPKIFSFQSITICHIFTFQNDYFATFLSLNL